MAKTQNSMAKDLTQGNVVSQLIRFAAPLLVSGLLQTLYNMVDAAVVGQVVGSDALAAVSVGGDVLHTLTFAAMGFASAGQVMISQFTGAGQMDKVKRVIGTLFTFMLSVSAAMTVVCLLIQPQLMAWLNTPVEAWDYAMDYVTPCILGLVFIYGYNLVSSILRGMGDSTRPFIFVAIATGINIVLDLLFVVVFGWAAFGAALATVIGQAASFILSIVYLYRHREQFGFDFKLKSFAIHKDVFSTIIRLGIPMVLQSTAVNFSRLFITSKINSYGVLITAVTGIGGKLDAAVNTFTHSVSTASGTMIGQCIGAEKYERVPKTLGAAIVIDAIVCVVMSLALVLFPRAIFGLFASEPETLDMAMVYIPVVLVNFASCIVRPPFFGLINGSGNARLNLIIGLLDGVIARIGLSVLLGEAMGFGIYGYWYGGALAGFVPFIIGGIYYLTGKWKTRKHVIQDS